MERHRKTCAIAGKCRLYPRIPGFSRGEYVNIGYLAITEFLSILENMQSSGVEEAGGLTELARKKGGIIKNAGDKPDERGEK